MVVCQARICWSSSFIFYQEGKWSILTWEKHMKRDDIKEINWENERCTTNEDCMKSFSNNTPLTVKLYSLDCMNCNADHTPISILLTLRIFNSGESIPKKWYETLKPWNDETYVFQFKFIECDEWVEINTYSKVLKKQRRQYWLMADWKLTNMKKKVKWHQWSDRKIYLTNCLELKNSYL